MTISHPSPGLAGASVTGASLLTPLVTHTPELQALGALIGVIAGILTVVWYVRQLLRK